MLITRVKINNMFQYKDFEVHLTDNVNLILGQNGAGKTNLLNCIRYAITGDLPTTKHLCVNRASMFHDGYVLLTFTADGDEYAVERHVVSSQHILWKNDKQIARNPEAVTRTIMHEVLNVTKRYMQNHVFVPQGMLRFAVESTPAERLAWIQKVLGLDAIQTLWTELGQIENTMSAKLSVDYEEEIEKLKSLKEKLSTIPVKSEEAVMAKKEQLEKFLFLVKELKQQEREINNLKAKLEKYQHDIDTMKEKLKIDEAKLALFLELMPNYDKFIKIKTKVTEIFKEFKKRPRRGILIPEAEIAELDKVIAQAEAIATEYESKRTVLLQRINELKGRSIKCPSCGNELECRHCGVTIKEDITTIELELAEIEKRLNTLKDLAYIKAVRQEKLSQNEEILNNRKLRKALLSKIKNAKPDYKQLKKYMHVDTKQLGIFRQNHITIQKLQIEHDNISNELKNALQRYECVKTDLDKITLTEEEIKDIKNEVMLLEERKKIEAQITILEPYVQKQEELKEKRNRLQQLKRVRAIFHSTKIVAFILNKYIRRMNDKIKTLLDSFNAAYKAELNQNMEYKIMYDNSYEVTEKELSYGEQLMLSLCYHLAINMLTPINLIVLDEPTLGLDEQRIQLMPELLNKFVTSTPVQFQILCCTHEKELLKSAKNVIQL